MDLALISMNLTYCQGLDSLPKPNKDTKFFNQPAMTSSKPPQHMPSRGHNPTKT